MTKTTKFNWHDFILVQETPHLIVIQSFRKIIYMRAITFKVQWTSCNINRLVIELSNSVSLFLFVIFHFQFNFQRYIFINISLLHHHLTNSQLHVMSHHLLLVSFCSTFSKSEWKHNILFQKLLSSGESTSFQNENISSRNTFRKQKVVIHFFRPNVFHWFHAISESFPLCFTFIFQITTFIILSYWLITSQKQFPFNLSDFLFLYFPIKIKTFQSDRTFVLISLFPQSIRGLSSFLTGWKVSLLLFPPPMTYWEGTGFVFIFINLIQTHLKQTHSQHSIWIQTKEEVPTSIHCLFF